MKTQVAASETADNICSTSKSDTRRFAESLRVSIHAPKGKIFLVPAKKSADLERGLMCVTDVPKNHGMLFVLGPPERIVAFWMKNTIVPPDMIFIGANGEVRNVAQNVPATPKGTDNSDIARRNGQAQYVIELAAGDARRNNIVAGSTFLIHELEEIPNTTHKIN